VRAGGAGDERGDVCQPEPPELSGEDARNWEQLDTAFLEIATDGRLETAVSDRVQEIAPELQT
jgi:hypothetical protein